MIELLPNNAPNTAREASARIYSASQPDIDVLRMMVLLEASGKGAYEDLARAATDPSVAELLRKNGREELAHAHRVKKAIKILTGVDYAIPALEMNPYYEPFNESVLTPEMLRLMAQSERRGETLYQSWANNTVDQNVADLFKRNGVEELQHSIRLEEAAAILATISS